MAGKAGLRDNNRQGYGEVLESGMDRTLDDGRDWSSGLFQCLDDEEVCWWTFWCQFYVVARTWDQFSLMASLRVIFPLVILYILWLVSSMTNATFFLLLSVFWCAIYPCLLAYKRSEIREKLKIQESWMGADCSAHFACNLCAIAQESREAFAAGLPALDFCSGQPLSEFPVSALYNNNSTNPIVDGREGVSTSGKEQDSASPPADMRRLSKTSKYILLFMAFLYVSITGIMCKVGQSGQILVLFLILLQPILVLYFFYYRTLRENVAFDYVVKLFAVGFFVTTIQAVCFEEVLQVLVLFIGSPFIARALGVNSLKDFGVIPGQTDSVSGNASVVLRLWSTVAGPSWRRAAGGSPIAQAIVNVLAMINQTSDMQGFDNVVDKEKLIESLPKLIRQNWILVFVGCFVMAFVVAAGVEETMKHFIVRCYRFGSALKDPYTITVFFLAGACGFATAENMSYVFGGKTGSQDTTSSITQELGVLLLRVLMPVHLICAVIQAVNVSKIVIGKVSEMSLFRVLLPAIILHGTFDFALFVLAVFSFAEDINTTAFEVFTLVVAAIIGCVGMRYAYTSFRDVARDFDFGFQALNDDTEHMEMSARLSI